MRLAIAVVTLALLPSLVALAPAAAQERDERQGISWPSRDFPTLQSAVDALSDGGTLRIAAGVFRLEQPLMIEGKRLIIEGAGCHPARPGRGAGQPLLPARGGPERPDRTTTLVGPAPLGVVEAGRAGGLLSYVGGGGVVRGVRLTGFDAGIVTRDGARGAIPLVVQDACISATGRGILALGGGAVSVVDSEISATMSNAISVKPTFTGSLVLAPYLTVNGAAFVDPGGACVYVSGALAFIGGSVLANCLGRG